MHPASIVLLVVFVFDYVLPALVEEDLFGREQGFLRHHNINVAGRTTKADIKSGGGVCRTLQEDKGNVTSLKRTLEAVHLPQQRTTLKFSLSIGRFQPANRRFRNAPGQMMFLEVMPNPTGQSARATMPQKGLPIDR